MKQTTSTLFLTLLVAVHLVHADDTLVMKRLIVKATSAQVSLAVRYQDGKGDKQDLPTTDGFFNRPGRSESVVNFFRRPVQGFESRAAAGWNFSSSAAPCNKVENA